MTNLEPPSSWFEYYVGALYSGDLNGEPSFDTSPRVQLLTCLCSRKIVRDSTLTKAAASLLPHALMVSLLKEALRCNNDRAVFVLLSQWPYPGVVLRELLDLPFASLQPLYCVCYRHRAIQESMRHTTSLAHSFIESLKKGNTSLHHLDLSGFPTPELMMVYVASHCLLVYNEARQDCMLNLYHKSVEEGKVQPSKDLEEMEMSFPTDLDVWVKMDAFVATQSSLGELARALKVSSFEGTRLRLVLSRLTVTSLGEPSISILLPLVNPEHLTTLQLRFNSLDFQKLQKLAPHLKTFQNLTSLDLSRNILDVRTDHHVVILKDILSSMPQLRRLDFAANSLKNRLADVLEVIQCPLESLCLASCRLTQTDLAALSRWPHIGELCELDLSDNVLASPLMLGAVCKAARQRLKVLVLEESLTDQTLPEVLPQLASMEQLMYLSFARHSPPCSRLENDFCTLSKLPCLQVVKSTLVESSLLNDVLMELRTGRAKSLENLSKALNAFRSKDRSPIKFYY